MKMKAKKIYLIIFFLILLVINFSKSVKADASSATITLDNINLVPNASIDSLEINGNNLYIGGNFTNVGKYIGNAFLLDISNNQAQEFVDKINGIVWTAVSDGNGGWYIGGDFNSVGNCNVGKLAHILANGRVDCNFDLKLDDTVFALYKYGNVLFIGGAFETILDRNLKYLAAINLNNGRILESFKFAPDDYVFTLALNTITKFLYVGGQFTNIININNNTSSNIPFINAINVSNTILEASGQTSSPSNFISFTHQLNDLVWKILITPDLNMYVAGYFDGYLKKMNFDGTFDTSTNFNSNLNLDYTVTSLAYNNDPNNHPILYIGGRFKNVNRNLRPYLAAIDAYEGRLISGFNATSIIPDDSSVDSVLDLLLINNRLYVAGSFDNNEPKFLRVVSATSGQLINDSNISNLKIGDRVNVLATDGNKIFIGGRFNTYNVSWKNYLSRINLQNRSIDNSFNFQTDKPVDKIVIDRQNNRIYLAGPFLYINNTPRTFFGAIDLNTNTILDNFNYRFSTTTGDFINDIEIDNQGNIYIAGFFESINNSTYKYLAKISSNGIIDSTFSNLFSPNGSVFDIEYDKFNNRLYVVGNFTKVGSINRKYVYSIDLTSSTLTSFSINTLNEPPLTIAVDGRENIIALGGKFSLPKENFILVNDAGNEITPSYSKPNLPVNKIKIDKDNKLMLVAGYFDRLGNDQYFRENLFIAKYGYISNGFNFDILPIFFSPDFPVYDIGISTSTSKLVLGGLFESVNNDPNNNIVGRNFSIRNLAVYNYITSYSYNPTPQISSISPNQIFATTSNVTINIYGNGFVNGITAYINNNSLSTTFVSSTNIRVIIPSNIANQPGQYNIKVVNPTPCNNNQCESNTVSFTILSSTENVFLSTTTLSIQEGSSSSYKIWLSYQPTATVTISLTTSPNNQINVSPSTITFTPSDYSTKTITVTATDDNIYESNHQAFIRHSVSSQDTRYNNYPLGTVTVNIIENDQASIYITAPNSITLLEGQNYQYNVRLTSQPLSTVTISISHNPTGQLIITPSTITFNSLNWNSYSTITITAIDNNIADGNRTINIEHRSSSTDNFYNNLTKNISVNIVDNDRREGSFGGGGGGSGGGGGEGGFTAGDGIQQREQQATSTVETQQQDQLLTLLLLLSSQFSTQTTTTRQEEKIEKPSICQKYEEFDFQYIKQKLPENFYFTLKTIRPGTISNNVKYLQIILNSNPKTLISKTGLGSKNRETRKYGLATLNAVKKFQKLYMNIKKPSGITGVNTIKEINKILKCVWENY
jgi:hypothetical protein